MIGDKNGMVGMVNRGVIIEEFLVMSGMDRRMIDGYGPYKGTDEGMDRNNSIVINLSNGGKLIYTTPNLPTS